MDLHFLVASCDPVPQDDAGERAGPRLNFAAGLCTGDTFSKQQPPSTPAIGAFCYPMGQREMGLPLEKSALLKYTFTLVDTKGKPLHGFCRRAARVSSPATAAPPYAHVRSPPRRACPVF